MSRRTVGSSVKAENFDAPAPYAVTDAGARAVWPCLTPRDRIRLYLEHGGWRGLPNVWDLPLVFAEAWHRRPV